MKPTPPTLLARRLYATLKRTLPNVAFMSLTVLSQAAPAADSPRERLSLDFGWKFHLGNEWGLAEKLDKAGRCEGPARISFNDGSWRTLNLPHDWAVELPFDAHADYDHGYKPVGPGYPATSVGWYRRPLNLTAADRGKKLWLEFDGVYRDCRVFLNGYLLTHQESGYNGFRCDITDIADCGGTNVLAVRVDATEFEGWFYEGAGIYRHVWLEKTAPLAIAPDGVFVWSTFKDNVPVGPAEIHAQVQLLNAQNSEAQATVIYAVEDANGQPAAEAHAEVKLAPWSQQEVSTDAAGLLLSLDKCELWSPENPKLYKLVTIIKTGGDNGQIVDRQESEFGIRTLGFDTSHGFLLNGQPYPIKGTCNHQDHAGVGAALPDALQSFRVAKLKEMGCNAIRTSHNEPTAELLAACDHLGMLVMDENRRFASDPQNLAYLTQQIRRDRNHPSVFIWSLCNEEHWVQQEPIGARIFRSMQNVAHELDPTRMCTAATDGWSEGKATGFSTVMDVQGFNYLHRASMDAFHRANPSLPCIGTEEASAFATRGIYENTRTYDSAYDDNKPDYGTTAEEWWKFYHARPWATGSFVWTGFDYRGEESPFHWPNISSEFGILDTCGFPKDPYYYYQAWWTDKPVLHVLPHWNWPGEEGQDIDVRVFSNCQEVELFLNGQSLGRKTMSQESHLQWQVKYAPGSLSARGYTDGKLIAQTQVETTGAPAAVQLTPDRATISADGQDCSVVMVSIADSAARIVPTANNLVHFSLNGPGKIIGVGNGDPSCHEPDVLVTTPVSRGVAINDWIMEKVPNTKDRVEVAEDFRPMEWGRVDVNAATGPLQAGESAVFRAHVSLTGQERAATESAVLHFGMIDDEGWVYVNGQFVGESHDWRSSPSFDIQKFLHAGSNTIAVVVKNNENEGGINKGVTLELVDKPVAPDWQRSVFNGLAEVIVQADKDAGPIQLTATADGLTSKTVTINTRPREGGSVLSAAR